MPPRAPRLVLALLFWAAAVAPRLLGAQPARDAAVESMHLPEKLTCEEAFPATITVTNTGNVEWTGAEALQAVEGTNPLTEEVKIGIPAGVTVAPGESHTFRFTLTAPEIALPSTRTAWRMVDGSGSSFGETASATVSVECPPRIDDAEVVSADLPIRLECGQSYAGQVTVRNAGTTNWSEREGYALGQGEDSARFHAPARVPLKAAEVVPPEADRTFSLPLTAPPAEGTYVLEWRMTRAGGGSFGAAISQRVKVGCSGQAPGPASGSESVPAAVPIPGPFGASTVGEPVSEAREHAHDPDDQGPRARRRLRRDQPAKAEDVDEGGAFAGGDPGDRVMLGLVRGPDAAGPFRRVEDDRRAGALELIA